MPRTGAPLFRAIAECTYDWESWVDPEGRLGWVNAAVERMTGYTVDECMAMRDYPLPLVHDEDRARVLGVFRSAAGGSVGNDVEFRVLGKDGRVRWAAVSWQPLVDAEGRSLGFRASVRDIDERKELESQLRASRARAEAADRAKTELLANVSHELRAPAHCVAGYAELLLEAGLEGEAARRADLIRSQASLLLRQVEDLLDMASLESGGVSLERRPVALEALLRNAVDPFVAEASAKGVALEVRRDTGLPASFLGDELRLSQVLRNLVENAVKHTERGRVTVELDVAMLPDGSGSSLSMIVRDTGVGIPPDRLDDVLLPFVQVGGAATRGRRGVGLGLSIAARLARLMGGSLALESGLCEGTTARVTLPVEIVAAAPSAAPMADDEALAARIPLDVLVVDDTPASRDLLAEQLVRLGYVPRLASSGEEALERVRDASPDLVLLDAQMPDLDGAEVAARLESIRKDDPAPRPRIVAVSASTFARERAGPVAARFDAFLLRPVSRARLRSLILELFGAPLSPSPDPEPPLLDAAVVEDLRAARDAGGRSMLERYSARAFTEVPPMLADARRAITAGDAEASARSIHAAAGVLASIGARRAAVALRELERALMGGSGARPRLDPMDALDAIERTLGATAEAIAALPPADR